MLSILSNKEIPFQTSTQRGASMRSQGDDIGRLLMKVDQQYRLLREGGFTDIYYLHAVYNKKTDHWMGHLDNFEAFIP